MSTLTLTPKLQITQPPAAPIESRPTLMRVLRIKFLRWLEKASLTAIYKFLMRSAAILGLALLIFVPQFLLGYLTSVLSWNSYRIPIFFAGLVLMRNAKPLYLFAKRKRKARGNGNQHTFHGLAISDLASFLKTNSSWKRDQAISEFALTQGRYARIAEALKKYDIVYHGENNALTLRGIPQGHLVMQLRALADGKVPPLVYDPEREIWAERDGAFARWTLDKEFTRRKITEQTERAERKLERVKQEASTFATLFA